MMKWIPVALALALSACSSSPKTAYYQLPTAGSTSAVIGKTVTTPVWVERVSVPDYLAGNGVVYQSNDVQFVIAANNQWASPLDQQLQQTLVTNLSNALPGALISSTPLGQQHDTLNVTVTGFHGRYDGHAVISGEWILEHNGQLQKQPFTLALPQGEDGYDGLVRTLAKGWQQVAGQVANAIIREQ
ncbi:membrane integrity-associated transporter subunit PqiC [Erwinia sorbitola]|uniref:Membrane integrity-associated transporter subunit PqiC n=1 Tax=Erwinia sorbitola TaxID=2681984 RepID=A0A6I6ESW1_9GAMM|nr:membrane integrity-associated transporter subunit PqiC [Erwinia sorbitola]MTD26579.1 membrane integrity-associated transporter subunit PqiC [Erwinia sorbitola]QGU88159.1 membrane integrity-associated transporter subunit PqiC [Erwinia sorbitola]